MRPYLDILRLPGALRFCAAGLLARSGGAMMAIGQVMMVSGLYGSYGLAGAVAASNGVAWAIGTAVLANLVDRYGQRRVMWPAALVFSAALVVLVVLGVLSAPPWTLFPAAMLAGAFGGAPGALVRARWNLTVRRPDQLHTAYALESTLDELTFVVGPVLATWLSTQVHPAAGLVAPVLLSLTGAHLFYSQRATEPPIKPRPASAQPADQRRPWRRLIILRPGFGAVVAVNVLVGCVLGGVDVTVVAAVSQWDARAWSGLVLACFSFASAVAGLAYGARSWSTPLPTRFAIGVLLLAVFASALLLVGSPLGLALGGVATGLAVAPSLINGNAIITRLAPPERLTEGLAWMGTSLGLGSAIGASLCGQAIDWTGHRGGFGVIAACGLASIAVTAVGWPALRRALASGRRLTDLTTAPDQPTDPTEPLPPTDQAAPVGPTGPLPPTAPVGPTDPTDQSYPPAPAAPADPVETETDSI
ncbi:MAG: MFS transporter [Propionibacteriaceae bacterium]|jgi:MFS family permease|nr:MFS transporter [Propionibacteriaceae bacterium]